MPSARALPLLAAAALVAGGVWALAAPARGEDAASKPVAQIRDIMFTFNEGDQSVVGVLRAQFNQASLDEDGWTAAKARATMIYEAGNMLLGMKPPRGADDAAGLAKWKAHVGEYQACAQAARDAAAKQDLAAGKAAMQALAKKCTECHKEHQKQE